MVKTRREFILATCFLSGAAAIVSFVALGTPEWVTSTTRLTDDNGPAPTDTASFGLFTGQFSITFSRVVDVPLTMICDLDNNICALLCGNNMGDNLGKLYNHKSVNQSDVESCFPTDTKNAIRKPQSNKELRAANNERIFINAGLWLTTIIFLILSALIGLFSTGLAVWNVVASPYQAYFSIFALYIYNGLACLSVLLSVILWGACFGQYITDNVPTYQTFLDNYSTKGLASLGYSFWINLVSIFLYIASICSLYVRQYLISKEPKNKLTVEDHDDRGIYLY